MEESNSWRNPVDLIRILERAFEVLPQALERGRSRRGTWAPTPECGSILLGDDPQAIADALLSALNQGASEEQLAACVSYAAGLRIARFHTANEFGDWDTALHTFTFANAVHQGLRRSASPELLRGVFDAAISVYLDRFLNIPETALPDGSEGTEPPGTLLDALPDLLDRQQQVHEAGKLVAHYMHGGGHVASLQAMLGHLLLREDRDFHTIQTVEAAARLSRLFGDRDEATHMLIAAARYLAAHSPTVRAQGQTYQIAHRLHRGEHLYAD
jgi:hypothetical protein